MLLLAQHIKRKVLEEGALQPVIGLLASKCHESQREAALLLGQFATTEPDYKARIVQRGAVPPLIEMLKQEDIQLREMAAFALGRLAQNQDNQAGIVQVGGVSVRLQDKKAGIRFASPATCGPRFRTILGHSPHTHDGNPLMRLSSMFMSRLVGWRRCWT